MTAIIRTYTESGFVIAADGRSTNSSTGDIVSDTIQKIYQFGNNPLALTLTGAAQLGRADRQDTEEVLFNFDTELRSAGEAISARRFSSVLDYTSRIAERVHRLLQDAISRGNIELPSIASSYPGDVGEAILEAFLDGYHNRKPERVRLCFFHERGQLLQPRVVSEPLELLKPRVIGIPQIGDLMVAGDQRILEYTPPNLPLERYSHDLQLGIIAGATFVSACGGREAHDIDSRAAGGIGGHLHMATVTPEEGFSWIPGFEPAPNL